MVPNPVNTPSLIRFAKTYVETLQCNVSTIDPKKGFLNRIWYEQFIAAERGKEKIAVEIKSFIRESMVSEFHTAAGQFINYIALQVHVRTFRSPLTPAPLFKAGLFHS